MLVLLPGMDGTGELFQPLVKALAALGLESRVVPYPGDQCLSYSELEEHVRSRLPEQPYVLLGESFSGPIAIRIAACAPSPLRGLVLCCTFASCPRPWARKLWPVLAKMPAMRPPTKLVASALLGRYADPGLSSLLGGVLAKVSPTVLRHRLVEVLRVNVREDLARTRVPVLNLRASGDTLVPDRISEEMQRLCPTMHARRLNGPHALLQSAPQAAAEEIAAFMHDVAHWNTHP